MTPFHRVSRGNTAVRNFGNSVIQKRSPRTTWPSDSAKPQQSPGKTQEMFPSAGSKKPPVTEEQEIFQNQWVRTHLPKLLCFMLRLYLTNSSLLCFPLEEGTTGKTMFPQFWSPHFSMGSSIELFQQQVSECPEPCSTESTQAAPEQIRQFSGQLRTGHVLLSGWQLALVRSQGQTEGGSVRWW